MAETIEITNFSGKLTRKIDGDLNSGFANFTTSFGYDPFSKPGNLTWFEAPVDISTGITDLIVAAKPRFESGTQYIYALGSTGKLYKIQPNSITSPNVDSVIGIGSVLAGSSSYNFGGSIEFFGATEKIYIGSDSGVNSINFDFTADQRIGGASNYTSNRYRPLKQFIGKLFYGNGNNLGAIDSTGTIVPSVASSGQINPALPTSNYVTDLDVAPDGNYLYITATTIPNENITTVSNDRQDAASGEGYLYKWNAIDQGITALSSIPSYAVTALQTYLNNNIFFSNDSFGASLNDGTNKLLTLPNNKAPFPNSTTVTGNFISWVAPELVNGTALSASMYYYGKLDENSENGLWRVMRYGTTLSSGFIYQTPVNLLTNNKYSTVNNAITSIVTLGYGKHYFSVYDVNSGTNSYKLLRFLITPTGSGTPQLGVYQTQTQLFGKRVSIKQIRVYTEPTATNNGFQIDLVGSDGAIITNGTFNYSYSAGTGDITKLEGSLERINFNPKMMDVYACALRITNTGTSNMTIKKIEVDWEPSGK